MKYVKYIHLKHYFIFLLTLGLAIASVFVMSRYQACVPGPPSDCGQGGICAGHLDSFVCNPATWTYWTILPAALSAAWLVYSLVKLKRQA
jgi:hypothetical protein